MNTQSLANKSGVIADEEKGYYVFSSGGRHTFKATVIGNGSLTFDAIFISCAATQNLPRFDLDMNVNGRKRKIIGFLRFETMHENKPWSNSVPITEEAVDYESTNTWEIDLNEVFSRIRKGKIIERFTITNQARGEELSLRRHR